MACDERKHSFKANAFLDCAKGGWAQIRSCPCGIEWTASAKTRNSPETHVYVFDGEDYDTLEEADAAVRAAKGEG